ncbi:MAG: hypothetical protein LBJ82_00295, partial [Deltaproteobacteria bacterium]|nr:hypothetical protein [Deltaproteobacteria bacterium]
CSAKKQQFFRKRGFACIRVAYDCKGAATGNFFTQARKVWYKVGVGFHVAGFTPQKIIKQAAVSVLFSPHTARALWN